MLRVLIADDHPLFRSALREVIEGLDGEHEIHEAGSLEEACGIVARDRSLDLDLILLDLQMPGSTGFSGLVTLRNAAPAVPIVVVSASCAGDVMRDSITYGASGFIPKSFSKDEIGAGMACVLAGDVFLPQELGSPLGAKGTASTDEAKSRIPTLTSGELRVLGLLARGKSNKIIAYELGIKESTVKAHITSILRKLRVHSRTQAVLVARDLKRE